MPMMFDDFMLDKERVVNHPRLKKVLHAMRITGKPMRYIMELLEPSLGEDFKYCLNEIKNMIELMGEIHDCDAAVEELTVHLKEVRLFNLHITNRTDRFVTRGLRTTIDEFRDKREKLFVKMCGTFTKWGRENLRRKLISSMNTQDHSELRLIRPEAS